MAPIIRRLEASETLRPVICVSAQHRHLLDQMMSVFGIRPDFDLNIMTEEQSLATVMARAVERVSLVIDQVRPRMVIVQGDTTTTLAAALAGFYHRIPVGHVEAGLRSGDRFDPFPEELNRRLTTQLTEVHYAPTQLAALNLRSENVPAERIVVTGNTVVDALLWILDSKNGDGNGDLPLPGLDWAADIPVLVTAHRRENWAKIEQICAAIRRIVAIDARLHVVFPVHPNPRVHRAVHRELGSGSRIHLLPPLAYVPFVGLMNRCRLVVTDSGGIQEEVASLGKPVIIMRKTTERPEVLEAGNGVLAGTDPDAIERAVRAVLFSGGSSVRSNPFGDGTAAVRIVDDIAKRV